MILPSVANRVQYILKHKGFERVVIPEPIGWDSDEKEYARNKKHHGIIPKFSNSLKFIGEGAEYILLVEEIYGVNADLKLTKKQRHPITDKWEVVYSGNFDLTTLKEEKKQVSVKFHAGSFDKVRKSRFSKKVEIDRTTNLDGGAIPELEPKIMALDGREIFRKTDYDVKDSDNSALLHNTTNDSNERGGTVAIPVNIVNKSHTEAQSVTPNSPYPDNSQARIGAGDTSNMFFAISEKDRVLRIKFELTFTGLSVPNNLDIMTVYVMLTTYKDGTNYTWKDHTKLFEEFTPHNLVYTTHTIQFEADVPVLQGESLSLNFQHYMHASAGGGHLSSSFYDISCPMVIEEDSFVEASQSKVMLAEELGERLTRITTGKENAFYSEFFGRTDILNPDGSQKYTEDGPGAYTGFSHGMWIRQFDKSDTLFKSFTTSWKDFHEANEAVLNMGLGIDMVGKRERIRYELLDFFYQNHVTIKLGKVINGTFEYLQPNNIKRTKAKEYLYTGAEFSCIKAGEYEEVSGLDEYNAKATFSTPIKVGEQIYKRSHKYRTDPYGQELTRIKSRFENSTEDYRTDKEIFMNDLKKGDTEVLLQRKWQDDFEEEPTGVFSPSTATNLRFSPVNCLLRHGWVVSASGLKYLSNYVRYNSSTGNSSLTTKLRADLYPTLGGAARAENGDIQVKDLQRARFVPEWVEFEYKVDFFINQAIQGSTTVLGKVIPNFYGLVQYKNEDGDLEKGFLFSVKPNGKGKWRILKANR